MTRLRGFENRGPHLKPLVVCVAVVVGSIVASFVALAAAQAPRFRARTDVVTVTVTVSDNAGRIITGLTRDDFEVFEDGVQEQITQFADGRVPVSLGVVLD